MYKKIFTFGTNLISSVLFTEEQGYGFVDQEHLNGKTKSEQALFSGGWNLRSSAQKEWKQSLTAVSEGVRIQSNRFVMIFKVLVPEEGSYRVTVKITAGAEGIPSMMLFSGRRNLIERDIQLAPNQSYEKSFLTYVAPYIPAMTSTPCTEKAIYISAAGKYACFSEICIEKTESPVLFIAGDSTLTDQNALFPYYPYGSCAGWAQVISQYFNTLAVCNQAHSGMTTNCFREDGHWDIIRKHLKKNDIVLLEFGHNDQKRRNLSAFGGYLNNLRWYIKEIRKQNAYPVLLSPISRIPFQDNGRYRSLLTAYAEACKMAAEECQVPFIDLHTLTFHFWCKIGAEAARDYFIKGDITHTNDYGANQIAAFVVSEILRQSIEPLNSLLDFSEKKAFLPDQDTKEVPDEPNEQGLLSVAVPYVDIQGISQYPEIVKALHNGLLDPCVMYLHPTEDMPRAQFLMVLFKALRIAGKRPYLGEFCDLSKYEWDSSYVQACIEENLIDPATVSNGRFRPDDALTREEFSSFVIRGIQKNRSERDIPLKVCYEKAIQAGILSANGSSEETICRADCYAGLVRTMELLGNLNTALPSDAEIHPVG